MGPAAGAAAAGRRDRPPFPVGDPAGVEGDCATRRAGGGGAEAYYALLGVERGASRAEVKRAYSAAAKECHPDAAAADAAAFRQLTDAYAIVCAEILADDRRRGGGRGRREGGGGAQPSTAEIMREITDDILEMVEMDVDAEAGPRGWLPPAG